MTGRRSRFAKFDEAKVIVRHHGISTFSEYAEYVKSDNRLPVDPYRAYKNFGWIDWYDFLGLTRVYLYGSYEEARSASAALNIKTREEYLRRSCEDPRLPRAPYQKYKGVGWVSWPAFFEYDYSNAKLVVAELGIKSVLAYLNERKLDACLPVSPDKTYLGDGWGSWREFLGVVELYSSYKEAQSATQRLGIKTSEEYKRQYHADPGLPRHPEDVYRCAWCGWPIFLGTRNCQIYSLYSEAAASAQKFGFKNRESYSNGYKLDEALPSNPNQVYSGKGWVSWPHFLGGSSSYSRYLDARQAALFRGFKSKSDYQKRYRVDPRLPRCPDKFYAGTGWVSWTEFLNLRVFYRSYEEASSAARVLGIKSCAEYLRRYSRDPQLPSTPSKVYSGCGWVDWYDFLGIQGKTKYETLAEIKESVARLGITSVLEYRKRRSEDPLLPAAPDLLYSNSGWVSWMDLLGIDTVAFYDSYSEAQAAAWRLSFGGKRSRNSYSRCYRDDPKLPCAPDQVYKGKGWVDWPNFLGVVKREHYQNYIDAQLAVRELGIKTSNEYKRRYREDSSLPACPYKFYRDSGWTDWHGFLTGDNRVIDVALLFPNFWSSVKRWLDDEVGLNFKISTMKAFLGGYYRPLGYPDDVRYILLRSSPFDAEAYQGFIESQAETRKKGIHNVVDSFFRWALEEYCIDEDDDERVVLPGCRSPFATMLAGYSDSLPKPRPTQSTKPPLGYEYILRAREYLVPNSDSVLVTRPALKEMEHLHQVFDSRIDWAEVPEHVIDYNDPHCVWRMQRYIRVVDGQKRKVKVYQIWSPVRFIALYTLLRYPLRGQQIVLLDSGESDEWIPVLDCASPGVKWVKNTSALVDFNLGRGRSCGVIQRGQDDIPNAYINTNKTGRGMGGYEVEWIPDDLVYWLIVLREWQEKYNPISTPMHWVDVKVSNGINKKILKARGAQCFLFRLFGSGQPPSPTTAFTETLPTLLYRIQRVGENLAKLDKLSSRNFVSPYTPHCLRVSLITAYIADGDAPIHVISKLVGHASLVMTIYYIRMSSDQMRLAMGEAEKRIAHKSFERAANLIRSEGLLPMRSQLIATDRNRVIFESDVPASACIVFDWGICPLSASCCHIGGEVCSEIFSKDIYIPVEAGYLGKKNCLRCRFFVTGIPFLGGLVALANEISLEVHAESGRYQELSREVEDLERQHYDACLAQSEFLQFDKLKSATANMQQSADKLDIFLTDYSLVVHYIQAAIKLINYAGSECRDDESVKLISSLGAEKIQACFEGSSSHYHLLAEICQNATIYQFSNPSRALPLISQAIDRMAENNNLIPAMFRLNDAQKLVVANQLNALLMQRLGSWERIDDLFSGDLMLLDIDAHEPNLARISTEIVSILSYGDVRKIADTVTSNE